jgi:hypothetical protein
MISNIDMSETDSTPKLQENDVKSIMHEIKEGYIKIDNLGESVILILVKTGAGKSTLTN